MQVLPQDKTQAIALGCPTAGGIGPVEARILDCSVTTFIEDKGKNGGYSC
jgi:hypothetical protein